MTAQIARLENEGTSIVHYTVLYALHVSLEEGLFS